MVLEIRISLLRWREIFGDLNEILDDWKEEGNVLILDKMEKLEKCFYFCTYL